MHCCLLSAVLLPVWHCPVSCLLGPMVSLPVDASIKLCSARQVSPALPKCAGRPCSALCGAHKLYSPGTVYVMPCSHCCCSTSCRVQPVHHCCQPAPRLLWRPCLGAPGHTARGSRANKWQRLPGSHASWPGQADSGEQPTLALPALLHAAASPAVMPVMQHPWAGPG